MNNKSKKKLLVVVIIIVAVLLVVGITATVIYFVKESKKDSNPVEVVNVSDFSGWYNNGSTISGSIMSNSQQNIYPNAISQVEEVFVKEGDVIKVGDPLVQYDITSNNLQLETERTSVELIRSQVKQAERKLEELKKIVPLEDMPEPTPDPLPPTTQAPTTETPTTEAPTTQAPTPDGTTQEAPTTEAPTTEAPTTEAPTTEAPTTQAPIPDANDEEIYTRAEKEKAIKDKEKEIRDLILQLEMAQLQYDINKESSDNGTVLSTCSGVVQKVNDYEEALSTGEPFIVIGGNTGYSLTAYIDEWQLANIEIGMNVSINCYDNGMMYDGVISELSDIPEENYYGMGTVSFYPLTIEIYTNDEIPQYAWAEVSLASEEETSDNIVIPKAYVREENGQKYVLKAVDGRLQKQYVTTGKIYWGTEVEIKSGLSMSDQIAFPYGKNAVEGKVVTESSSNMYY